MKTANQVDDARKKIAQIILESEVYTDSQQKAVLNGILCALIWVADGSNKSTVDTLLREGSSSLRRFNA